MVNLTHQQKDFFRREGYLILRKTVSSDLMEQLGGATEDLAANETLHCAMARYGGPAIFHQYDLFCVWPDLVHDIFRDVVYRGPLAHIASQLMEDQPVRIFNTYSMGSSAGKTLPLRWHSDYGVFTGGHSCNNGLVMWLPVLEAAHYAGNGLILAEGSHRLHEEMVENGTWNSYTSSISGQLQVLNLYKRLGGLGRTIKPTLHPGDVLIFNKCLVHSSSGVNTLARRRWAWQVRFLSAPQDFRRGMYQSYPEMGQKHGGGLENEGSIEGVKYPLLFPETLPEEDAKRAEGHQTLTRGEWMWLMLSYPDHLLATNFVRLTENLGLDLNGPLLKTIVQVSESFGII